MCIWMIVWIFVCSEEKKNMYESNMEEEWNRIANIFVWNEKFIEIM